MFGGKVEVNIMYFFFFMMHFTAFKKQYVFHQSLWNRIGGVFKLYSRWSSEYALESGDILAGSEFMIDVWDPHSS